MNKNHFLRNLVSILLLATLCIGATELAFCRVADPELFAKVTAPVVALSKEVCTHARTLASLVYEKLSGAAYSASNAVSTFIESTKSALESLAPSEEPQIADGPAIEKKAAIEDPEITGLDASTGKEILTGGNVPLIYYNQKDEAWANLPFGKDNIGLYGCGPTSMSMIVSSLTGYDVDPEAMASWAASQGYWAPQSGSYLSIVQGTAAHYGLNCSPLSISTPDELSTQFSSDSLIVALMGAGHFTKSGHFIVLHGATLDGRILVADPNSRDNSLTAWEPQLILDELSSSTDSGAPLWLITTQKPL